MILILQLLTILTLSLTTVTDAGGYYHYTTHECFASSSDLSDMEYILTYNFNKDPVVRFNSTVGKFEGYTAFGVKQADYFNSGSYLQQTKGELDRYCRGNLGIDFSNVLEKSVKPRIQLKSEQKASGSHQAMLACSAFDFYPKTINVYWKRDDKKVTGDVISTEEMAEGDWYYQIHSHLEYTPKSGEKISCVVEHVSSKEPIITDWDPSLPETDKNKIAIGASGLVLGIILTAAGFIYYKKKSSGRILVPS